MGGCGAIKVVLQAPFSLIKMPPGHLTEKKKRCDILKKTPSFGFSSHCPQEESDFI